MRASNQKVVKDIIILTVQPCSSNRKRWRLGINVEYSRKYFRKRYRCVIVDLKTIVVLAKTTCGNISWIKIPNPQIRKKGYDIYDAAISIWIKEEGFHCYPSYRPTELQFEIKFNPLRIIFVKEN